MAEAASLLNDVEVHAPALIDYELASAARAKVRRAPDVHDLINQLLAAILATDIRHHDVDQVAVVQLALETGLSTYDASYLHLARQLGVPLITFDRRLRAAFGQPDL